MSKMIVIAVIFIYTIFVVEVFCGTPSTQSPSNSSVINLDLSSIYPVQSPSPAAKNSPAPSKLPPSNVPSTSPSLHPSLLPTQLSSLRPSKEPIYTIPSSMPTHAFSMIPISSKPIYNPPNIPSSAISMSPSYSISPTFPTNEPTLPSTSLPSVSPSRHTSASPTSTPSNAPSGGPTSQPSFRPTTAPSTFPSTIPTNEPTLIKSSSAINTVSTALIGGVVAVIVFFSFIAVALYIFFHRRNTISKKAYQLSSVTDSTCPPIVDRRSSEQENSIEDIVPSIDWASVSLCPSTNNTTPLSCILGKGSYGVVIKGVMNVSVPVPNHAPSSAAVTSNRSSMYTTKSANFSFATSQQVVAIKVISSVFKSGLDKAAQEQASIKAMEEANIVIRAERKIAYKDCIIKVFGVAKGILPRDVCNAMNIDDTVEAFGIVMRYEGGGSLQSLIYKKQQSCSEINILEKLRLLKLIARGLAELHLAGIIHADIKPDNVLLSDNQPAEVRLADFGLSAEQYQNGLDLSTLAETAHTRGTPIYCAPELLFNPYDVTSSTTEQHTYVAKPSRKTDVYAFAILAWELLAERKPFTNAKNETMLSAFIHQGHRPDRNLIPSECPQAIIKMIESCWNTDRSQRKSAVECYSILNYQHSLLSKSVYDVYISHEYNNNTTLSSALFHRLMYAGLKVCYNQYDTESSESAESSITDINACKTFVVIMSQGYVDNPNCMRMLREMKKINPPRIIVPVFIDADYDSWCDQELKYLLQLRAASLLVYDITPIASDVSWHYNEDGPDEEILDKFHEHVDNLANFLKTSIYNPLYTGGT